VNNSRRIRLRAWPLLLPGPARIGRRRRWNSHQTWVTACIWNFKTRRPGFRTTTLVDSGASGGSYASAAFVGALERTEFGGQRIISRRGRGLLRAANPANSDVAPMRIVGTVLLPLVFPPVDRVFRTRVRVVDQLPIGLLLGAAFMWQYGGVLDLGDRDGAGSFRPAPGTSTVPILPPEPPPNPRPWRDQVQAVEPSRRSDGRPEEDSNYCNEGLLSHGCQASRLGLRTGRVRCERTGQIVTAPTTPTASTTAISIERFCSLQWEAEEEDDGEEDEQDPPQVMTAEALDLGAAAWEDGGTLRWPVTLTQQQDVDGRSTWIATRPSG